MPAGYTAGMSRAESGRRQGGSRLTVARYIRISTEEQRKGYSVRDQRRRLNEHSERGDGRNWSRAVLRQIVLSDCYLPYSFDDLQLLTEGGNLDRAVLAGLDPERVHGVWWFNRERVEVCNKDGASSRAHPGCRGATRARLGGAAQGPKQPGTLEQTRHQTLPGHGAFADPALRTRGGLELVLRRRGRDGTSQLVGSRRSTAHRHTR
jgi:hypothetical protein